MTNKSTSRYVIKSELGKGGMGRVLLAFDTSCQRDVAIKVLNPKVIDKDGTKKRLEREYTAAAQIRHPNVIQVFDYGVNEDGAPYIVMEFLPHPTLAATLSDIGRFNAKDFLPLAQQLAEALGVIHDTGVVHRDLKPENIVVSPDGRPIILDFGLSKATDFTTMTKTGAIIGTPQYLAPEQLRGHKATAQSDIHALGAIFFEMLAGVHPFKAKSIHDLASKLLAEDRPSLGSIVPNIGRAWEQLIEGCIALDPKDRYGSAKELLRDLQAIEERGQAATLSRPTVPVENKKSSQSLATVKTHRHQKHYWPAIVIVCLLVFLAYSLVGRGGDDTPFTVEALKTEQGPGWLVVSWSSERPYVSKLIFEEPRSFVTEGDSGAPVKNHQVIVSSLPENSNCSFRVLFPNGDKSLQQRVQLSRLVVELLEVEKKRTSVVLRWKQSHGVSTFIEWPGGRFKGEQVKGCWSTTLPWPIESKEATMVIDLGKGGKREIALAKLVQEQIMRHLRRLEGTKPPALVSETLEQHLGKIGGQPAWLAYAANLNKRIYALGLLNDFYAMADLSPFIFEGRFVHARHQYRVYKSLLGVIHMSLWSPALIGRRIFDLEKLPHLGHFALGLKASIREDMLVEVRKATEGRLGLTVNDRATIGERVKRWRSTFTIPSLTNVEAAEMSFTVSPLGRNYLRLCLNDQPVVLDVYDRVVLVHEGNPYLAKARKGKLDLESFVTEMATVSTLYQRIPLSVLKAGENKIELVSETLSYRDASWNLLGVFAVGLRLQKSR